MGFEINMQGFNNAMKAYAEAGNKLPRIVLPDQAQKLISNGFQGGGGLYQEARKHAKETIMEIKSLIGRYGYRIKRRSGVTIQQEVKRRLKNTGYVQSTGWLNRIYTGKSKVAVRHVKKTRGVVKQKLDGPGAFIELTNTTPGAAEFAHKTGYVQRAMNNRQKDMENYISKKLAQAKKKSFG